MRVDQPVCEGITRRGFLKAALLGAAAGLAGRYLTTGERAVVETAGAALAAGYFNPERVGRIDDLEAFARRIYQWPEVTEGLTSSAVVVGCGSPGGGGVWRFAGLKGAEVGSVVYPGSVDKLMIVSAALDSAVRVDEETLHQIINLSGNKPTDELAWQLEPKSERLEMAYRVVMTRVGVPPQNRVKDLPMGVRFGDLAGWYVGRMPLDDRIIGEMTQEKDWARNYGLGWIMRDGLPDSLWAGMKLGLVEVDDGFAASYLMIFGDPRGKHCFVIGSGVGDKTSAVLQMNWAAAVGRQLAVSMDAGGWALPAAGSGDLESGRTVAFGGMGR